MIVTFVAAVLYAVQPACVLQVVVVLSVSMNVLHVFLIVLQRRATTSSLSSHVACVVYVSQRVVKIVVNAVLIVVVIVVGKMRI